MTATKPSFVKYFFLTWLITPIVFGAAAWLVLALLNFASPETIPGTEVFIAVAIAVGVGLFLGPLLGVAAWAIRWGISGWASAASDFSAARQENTNEDMAVPPAAESTTPTVQIDPWGGKNPLGCCTFHTDDDGYPTHGGPGCKHPEAQKGR